MPNFKVLSINPETRLLERMSYETRVAAEAQQRRAIDQGRIMVEITATAEQQLEWTQSARKAITDLEGRLQAVEKVGREDGKPLAESEIQHMGIPS